MTKRKLAAAVLLIMLIAAAVMWFVLRPPQSAFEQPFSGDTASAELIGKGEYAARVSDCVACHSTPESAPFAGGLKFATPVGDIYATNITPDKETGIGNYTLADFDKAVRHGVAKDGHRLYPAMPYPSYIKHNDDDVRALYAYFMHSVKPVKQPNRESEIPWPLNMRWPMAFWNLLFVDPAPSTSRPGENAAWNRGAYIVEGPGHCGSCHTPRGLAFNEKGLSADSKYYLAGALLDGWYAPSLRGDANTGLGRWSEEDIYSFLKTGRNEHSVVFGSMTEAFNNSTQYMSDDDLRAIALYLKSLPPGVNSTDDSWKYDSSTASKLTVSERSKHPGAQTFIARCSSCHGVDGRGQAPWIPPLAGATSMLVNEASAINITLNGSDRIVAGGKPDAYRMPPFRKQLSDKEMTDVLNFVRSSWGNTGEKVKQESVTELRERTDPASSNVIILQMR